MKASQPLTHFAPVESPAQVLVLVETSPAVYLIHQQHLQAAYTLLEGLAADDRVALGTYDGAARLVLRLTENKLAIAQALHALHYNLGMGQLNLFDGLRAALAWLAPLPGKKAIVLLTRVSILQAPVTGRSCWKSCAQAMWWFSRSRWAVNCVSLRPRRTRRRARASSPRPRIPA